eukprot:Tamp_25800.p1 GENE.Tamp_25800~~Tamp_25800.p1  ORF type:complete len:246 (+),score=26.28 Tamp_25800:50-739(+)
MPLVLRAVFGGATRPFYLLENVIVDVEKQRMEIRTRNVNLDHICLCHSVSYYEPAAADPTRNTQYYMAVHTQAFPRATGHTGSKESLAVPSHFTISSLQQQRAHASPACARDADWPTPPQHPRSILSGTGAEGAQHGLDGPSHRPTSRHSGADGVEGGSAGAGGSGSGGSGFLRRSVEKFVGELVLGNVAKGETLVQDWARSLSLMPRKDSSGSPSAGRDVGAGVDSKA